MYPQVHIITPNTETGVAAGADVVVDPKDAGGVRAYLERLYGPAVGAIVARDARTKAETPLGTVHEQEDAHYPGSDRTFKRVAFAFVSTAAIRMNDAQRAAYLAADVGDAPKNGKRHAEPEPEPEAPAPKAGKRKVAKASPATPTPKKLR